MSVSESSPKHLFIIIYYIKCLLYKIGDSAMTGWSGRQHKNPPIGCQQGQDWSFSCPTIYKQ